MRVCACAEVRMLSAPAFRRMRRTGARSGTVRCASTFNSFVLAASGGFRLVFGPETTLRLRDSLRRMSSRGAIAPSFQARRSFESNNFVRVTMGAAGAGGFGTGSGAVATAEATGSATTCEICSTGAGGSVAAMLAFCSTVGGGVGARVAPMLGFSAVRREGFGGSAVTAAGLSATSMARSTFAAAGSTDDLGEA